MEHGVEGNRVEVAGDGQFIGSHRSFQIPVFRSQNSVGQHQMGPLAGQEGGGGVVGDEGAGDVFLGQLLGQQRAGGQGGAALAEGDLLQHIPLPAPAGDAQGPAGRGGVEGSPVGSEEKAGPLPHEVGAVAADVPVGDDLLPVIGDSGGQQSGQLVHVFGIGFWRVLHKIQGGGQLPGAGAAGQEQGLGLVQFLLKLGGLLEFLVGHGGQTVAVDPSHRSDLLLQNGAGGEGLGGLLHGGAGDPVLLLRVGRLVQKGQDAVLPLK